MTKKELLGVVFLLCALAAVFLLLGLTKRGFRLPEAAEPTKHEPRHTHPEQAHAHPETRALAQDAFNLATRARETANDAHKRLFELGGPRFPPLSRETIEPYARAYHEYWQPHSGCSPVAGFPESNDWKKYLTEYTPLEDGRCGCKICEDMRESAFEQRMALFGR